MLKSERDDLIRLAKSRAKIAKTEIAERQKILLAEIEDLLAREYEAEDALWAEAMDAAKEQVRKANDLIVAQCAGLGIPARHAPEALVGWYSRSPSVLDPSRRGELRKVAQTRLTALSAAARTQIDKAALEAETALIAGSLESSDAKAILEAMPTPEQLMPALSLDDLGVKSWQPPEGVASALLTPSTPADLRRRKVLRAIEANPDASDREIGRKAGVDGKTVAALRRRGNAELSATETAEFRADDAEFRADHKKEVPDAVGPDQ